MKRILILLVILPLITTCKEEPVYYSLTITSNPHIGGSFSPNGGLYGEGDSVTITATPNAPFSFEKWSEDWDGSENPLTLIMDGNKKLVGNFELVPVITKFSYSTPGDEISISFEIVDSLKGTLYIRNATHSKSITLSSLPFVLDSIRGRNLTSIEEVKVWAPQLGRLGGDWSVWLENGKLCSNCNKVIFEKGKYYTHYVDQSYAYSGVLVTVSHDIYNIVLQQQDSSNYNNCIQAINWEYARYGWAPNPQCN